MKTKIGVQWYEFTIPQGKAGIRCHGPGDWGFYFRGPNGEQLGKRDEYGAVTYKGAKNYVDHFAKTGVCVLDPE